MPDRIPHIPPRVPAAQAVTGSVSGQIKDVFRLSIGHGKVVQGIPMQGLGTLVSFQGRIERENRRDVAVHLEGDLQFGKFSDETLPGVGKHSGQIGHFIDQRLEFVGQVLSGLGRTVHIERK